MTRHETYARLMREGRSVEDISLTFGLTTLQVKRTLALGNLMPRIRSLYRAEKIDAVTIRHLTLASKAQQRDWLALLDDEVHHAPTRQNLKAWLLCRARHNSHWTNPLRGRDLVHAGSSIAWSV